MAPNDIAMSYELTPHEIAEQLILNGFSPCPLEPMSKAIKVKDWTNKEFSPDQFTQKNGVGIKTGNGLVAIDIDVYDPKISTEITQAAFQELGPTFARVGQAPKIALLYRSTEMASKIIFPVQPTGEAPTKKTEAIEVLASGQQLVAAAIHPETERPYCWDGTKPWSPITGHIKNLPLIDAANWQKFHKRISHLLVQESFTHHTALKQSGAQNRSLGNDSPSAEEVQEILSYISSTLDYNTWIMVTMGLKSLGDQYRTVWLNWSATGQNHDPFVDPAKWDQVSQNGSVTFKTVCHYAQQNGADLSAIALKYFKQVYFHADTAAKDSESPRGFEGLLEAIQALSENDIEGTEAIIDESKSLPSIKRETIDQKLKDATGYTLTAIRKQRSELFDADPEPDQLDLAKKTISEIGRDNVLHTKNQTWLWNQAGVWSICEDRKIKQTTQRVIDSEEIDVSAGLVNGVSDVLKSEINSADHLFNLGNPETVNCLNGQLELEDGIFQLRPHKREEYRTTQVPISYDPKASAKRFQRFLTEIFESDQDTDDKIECLLQMIGYTLMSHSRHEKFIMLIGNGANGKSVLLAIIEALCGSTNVAGVQPSKFESSFQRAHLHNKLANIVTELSEGEKLADAELKSITSGEPVTVEHKYQHPFNMRPYSTCWFGTNHMPPTSDFSEALFRRAVIVTFNRTFQPHEQNPNLKDDLENELSGILNLALAAYARALKNGFTIPASAKQARDEWKLETNQVAQFVIDECDERPEAAENFSDLYRCYQGWAHRNYLTLLTPKTFSSRLQRVGFNNSKSGPTRKFKGLQLKR
jgi:putative DNA primase/helicase